MDKQRMVRAALLAVLVVAVIVIGWLCLGTDNPMIVEIEAPIRVTRIPAVPSSAPDIPSLALEPEAPKLNEPEQEKEQTSNFTVTYYLGTLTIGTKKSPLPPMWTSEPSKATPAGCRIVICQARAECASYWGTATAITCARWKRKGLVKKSPSPIQIAEPQPIRN